MKVTSLKLHHIGESLVSAMLQDLAENGKLGSVSCAIVSATGGTTPENSSFEEALASLGLSGPLAFIPDKAYLLLEWDAEQFTCDGAQRADVLCSGSGNKAVALELKLGLTRMSATAFEDRFLKPICQSDHADQRVKGSMVALLDRRIEGKPKSVSIQASIGAQRWEVVEPWWLVVRRSVWQRWDKTRMPSIRHGRILIMDELVHHFGGEERFNLLVRDFVSADYYNLWKFKP